MRKIVTVNVDNTLPESTNYSETSLMAEAISTAIQNATQGKLDAVEGSYRVYINNHEGVPSFIIYSATDAGEYTLMQRDGQGRSVVETPQTEKQIANKEYVDAHLYPGTVLSAKYDGSAWPSRPTPRTDITVMWIGNTETAPEGMLEGDVWHSGQ